MDLSVTCAKTYLYLTCCRCHGCIASYMKKSSHRLSKLRMKTLQKKRDAVAATVQQN